MLITLFIMSIIGLGAGILSSILNYDTDRQIKEIRNDIDETNKWIRNQYKEKIKERNKKIEELIKEDKK